MHSSIGKYYDLLRLYKGKYREHYQYTVEFLVCPYLEYESMGIPLILIPSPLKENNWIGKCSEKADKDTWPKVKNAFCMRKDWIG